MTISISVTFDGVTIIPNRSEEDKYWDDADVSNYLDSIAYAAGKAFEQLGKTLNPPLPLFSSDEIDTMVTSRVSEISGVAELSDPDLHFNEQDEVLNPTSDEKSDEIDDVRGFTDDDVQALIDKQNSTYGDLITDKTTGTDGSLDGTTFTDGTATFQTDLVAADDVLYVEGMVFQIQSVTDETHLEVYVGGNYSGPYKIGTPLSTSDGESALRVKDSDGAEVPDIDEATANTLILNRRKNDLSRQQILYRYEKCTVVPSLSTEVESGTCDVSSDDLEDSSATFQTNGVAAGDIVVLNENEIYKVSSVTSETVLVLDTEPGDNTSLPYAVYNSRFAEQFEYRVKDSADEGVV